jgi:hypothetical protein
MPSNIPAVNETIRNARNGLSLTHDIRSTKPTMQRKIIENVVVVFMKAGKCIVDFY